MMMISGVIETFAICRWYCFHWLCLHVSFIERFIYM